MTEDLAEQAAWDRVGALVRARRKELRPRLTQAELAAKAGSSEPTVRRLEAGRPPRFEPATLEAVSAALGYTPDSLHRVLAGKEPAEAPPTPANGKPSTEDRIAALEAELARLRARLDERESVTPER